MATFTEEQRANLYRGAETVGNLLQDRFNQKQAEEFVANDLQSFQNGTSEFFNSLATLEDGDALAAGFTQWKNNTLMPFITQSTARYAKNDRIMEIVKQVSEANQNGLSEYMQVEEAGHAKQMRPELEERARAESASGINLESAQAQLARARAGVVGAEAEKEKYRWEVIPREMLPTIDYATAKNLVESPRHPEWKQQRDAEADQAAIASIIQQKTGQEKPDGTKWGADTEKDTVDASVIWSGNLERRNKARLAHKLRAAGFDPSSRAPGVFDDVLGFVVGGSPVLTPEEMYPPLKSNAKQPAFLGRIFAGTSDTLRQAGFDIETTDSFIKNTLDDLPVSPEGYRKLGPYVASVLEETVIRDADGTAIARMLPNQPPVKTYADLVKNLMAAWEARVTNAQIDPSATSLRSDSKRLGNAIIQKYAPIIGMQLGMDVPKAKKPTRPAIFGALESGLELLKGLGEEQEF
jgi:hypothetical protein